MLTNVSQHVQYEAVLTHNPLKGSTVCLLIRLQYVNFHCVTELLLILCVVVVALVWQNGPSEPKRR